LFSWPVVLASGQHSSFFNIFLQFLEGLTVSRKIDCFISRHKFLPVPKYGDHELTNWKKYLRQHTVTILWNLNTMSYRSVTTYYHVSRPFIIKSRIFLLSIGKHMKNSKADLARHIGYTGIKNICYNDCNEWSDQRDNSLES